MIADLDPSLLPAWAAWLIALLALAGSLLTLIGSIGLVRLRTFYERVHPPTMGSTLGIGMVLIGSMLLFTLLRGRPVLHEALIGVFVTLTTPITFMMLVRAARHRDEDAGPADPDADAPRDPADLTHALGAAPSAAPVPVPATPAPADRPVL